MPWEGAEYVLPGDEKAQPEAPGAPAPLPATGNVATHGATTAAKTPKTTDTPAQTGGGAPADKQATKEARKPRAAKAKSEVSKKPRGRA
jgi:NADH-quinone oxidoreductase subunit C